MIHDPTPPPACCACAKSRPARAPPDPGEQERRVGSWGCVSCHSLRLPGRIATLAEVSDTLPDSGTGLARWWAATAPRTSWAADTYAELIDRAGPAGERHATTLSLSLDSRMVPVRSRTAGVGYGAAAVLRQEMNTLVAALRSADLSPSGWLTPGQIAVMLRSAYDPPSPHAGTPREARPVACDRGAGRRHRDLGAGCAPTPLTMRCCGSASGRGRWCIGFLSPVLLSTGIQRSFSLICTPMRSRCCCSRHPAKKKVEHILRPGPAREDRPDRRCLPDRRVPRRAPTRSRPHRRTASFATPASSPSPHPPSKNSTQPLPPSSKPRSRHP